MPNKRSSVKTSLAIDFSFKNLYDKIEKAKDKIENAKDKMNPAASAATPSTAAFNWSKDEYAATNPDKEMYRVIPYVSGTTYSCLFGSVVSKGVKTEAYSEMVTFSGGHEASPSRPFFGGVYIKPLGSYTVVPKFVFTGGGSYPGATFSLPPTANFPSIIQSATTTGTLTGDWDYGPPAFWYDEVENKILCSHDCWQTVLISGNTAWDSVEYTYPNQRLIRGPGGYPYKNDVLRAEVTEIAYLQDPNTGEWNSYNRYRNGTTTAQLLSLGHRTEIYRVVSPYIVDGKEKWELPPGWPSDNTYPISSTGPKKFPKSFVTQQPWEIGYLMLDGTFRVDTMSTKTFKPYEGVAGYTPKFVYVEAKLSGDALDVRDTLMGGVMQNIRDKLAIKYPGIDLSSRA